MLLPKKDSAYLPTAQDIPLSFLTTRDGPERVPNSQSIPVRPGPHLIPHENWGAKSFTEQRHRQSQAKFQS